MADFRKISVLAVLALILGLASTASAQQQPFSCNVTAVPQDLRSEGLTELTGDLLITCTGGTSTPTGTGNVTRANITIFVGNTTVTSRLLSASTVHSSFYAAESYLMLDEPQPAGGNNVQALCPNYDGCPANGNGTGGFVGTVAGFNTLTTGYYGATGNYNMFRGLWRPDQPNAVSFLGVPIDPPGTNGTRVIRISNIRINANGLGSVSETAPPVQAQAFVSVAPFTALPISGDASEVVGIVRKSLRFAASTPTSYQQCISTTGVATTLTFEEIFASAWKRRGAGTGYGAPSVANAQNIPGTFYGTESGFLAPAIQAAAGLADFGTRLKVMFNNVPNAISVTVPTVISQGPALAPTFYAVLVSSETGSYAAGGSGAVALTATGATFTGQAVYEIVVENQNSIDTFTVPVTIAYTSDPGANKPGLTPPAATVTGSYAPISTVTVASFTAPIPRFSNAGAPTLNFLSVNQCATILLFPFVTNQVGFDTGIAISNTSSDAPVFATSPQTGDCTLYFYGANIPTGGSVKMSTLYGNTNQAAGTSRVALASGIAANFQGYVIAECSFQYAHGFAFVSDQGARNIAMGYLALIIPDLSVRYAQTNALSGTNSGEQLAQ